MNTLQPARERLRLVGSALVVILLSLISGCEGEAGVPRDGSPVVATDSAAFRAAQAETEKKLRDDAAAEAKARQRFKGVPPQG